MAEYFLELLAVWLLYAASYFLVRASLVLWHGWRHTPFQPPASQSPDRPVVLLLGDSTVASTGVHCWEDSCGAAIDRILAGRFAFELRARSGATVRDVFRQLAHAEQSRYGAIVIGVGANDVFRHHRTSSVERDLRQLLAMAAERTEHIVLFHCVNLGTLPLFPRPINRFYSYRTRQLRDLFERVASDFKTVRYVDFFRERPEQLMPLSVYCAADGVHPSKRSYRIFEQLMRREAIFDGL